MSSSCSWGPLPPAPCPLPYSLSPALPIPSCPGGRLSSPGGGSASAFFEAVPMAEGHLRPHWQPPPSSPPSLLLGPQELGSGMAIDTVVSWLPWSCSWPDSGTEDSSSRSCSRVTVVSPSGTASGSPLLVSCLDCSRGPLQPQRPLQQGSSALDSLKQWWKLKTPPVFAVWQMVSGRLPGTVQAPWHKMHLG